MDVKETEKLMRINRKNFNETNAKVTKNVMDDHEDWS